MSDENKNETSVPTFRTSRNYIKAKVLEKMRSQECTQYIERALDDETYKEAGFYYGMFQILAKAEFEVSVREQKRLEAENLEFRADINRREVREKEVTEELYSANRRLYQESTSHVCGQLYCAICKSPAHDIKIICNACKTPVGEGRGDKEKSGVETGQPEKKSSVKRTLSFEPRESGVEPTESDSADDSHVPEEDTDSDSDFESDIPWIKHLSGVDRKFVKKGLSGDAKALSSARIRGYVQPVPRATLHGAGPSGGFKRPPNPSSDGAGPSRCFDPTPPKIKRRDSVMVFQTSTAFDKMTVAEKAAYLKEVEERQKRLDNMGRSMPASDMRDQPSDTPMLFDSCTEDYSLDESQSRYLDESDEDMGRNGGRMKMSDDD